MKFLELVQGSLYVSKYEAKFIDLARFCTHQVENKARKALKFEQGLKPSTKTKFSALRLRSYIELVTRALLVEKDFMKFNPRRSVLDPMKFKGRAITRSKSNG